MFEPTAEPWVWEPLDEPYPDWADEDEDGHDAA